ncbi:MAG: hypothetical protein ACRDHF_10570, partial [Tepidiformaceae bacterium]
PYTSPRTSKRCVVEIRFTGTEDDIRAEMTAFLARGHIDTGGSTVVVGVEWPSLTKIAEYWDGLGDSRRFIADLITHGPGFVLFDDIRDRLKVGDMRGITAGPAIRWNFIFGQTPPYPFPRRASPEGLGYEVPAELVALFKAAAGASLERWA